MSVKKIFLLVLFFLVIVFAPKIYADEPWKITCGYADAPGKNECCEDKLVSHEDFEGLKKDVPKIEVGGKTIIDAGGFVDGIEKMYGAANPEEKMGINNVVKKCYLGKDKTDSATGKCICEQTNVPTKIIALKEICQKYTIDKEKAICESCADGGSLSTGIGCVPLGIGNFVTDFLLGRLIGLAGLIALLCIIYSAFMLQTSRGDPERLKKAQELLTSCIMGLMLIIFSVFILRLVGVDILKIPGFGKG